MRPTRIRDIIMKRTILCLITGFLLFGNLFSQVEAVTIDTYGNFEVIVRVDNGTVTVNSKGQVIAIDTVGTANFSYFTSGAKSGKIEKIDAIDFDYYTSGIKAEKIEKIGSVPFDYYTIGTGKGQIERIGATYFDYSNSLRIEKMGTLYLNYHTSGIHKGRLKGGNRLIVSGGIIYHIKADAIPAVGAIQIQQFK